MISQASYSKVKKGHIVPVSYQRNFALDEQVAVHIDRRVDCVALNIRDAATRSAFYRRIRLDGTEIDDIEASLSFIEAAAAPAFTQLIDGEPLTEDRMNVLAQFFGVQMVRGPAYFEQRGKLLDGILAGLGTAQFRPSAVRDAGGDVEVVRRRVREAYRSKTAELTAMLTVSLKVASVLVSMRWHLLRFDEPLLAYSDHPVVVWPLQTQTASPFATPQLAPLDALEVRVPISPELAVLMTWADRPDTATAVRARVDVAGELNAFTVSQADRQWMHRPGVEPPLAAGQFAPLSRRFEPVYGPDAVLASRRRARAARYQHRVRRKKFLNDIEIVVVSKS